MNKILFSCLQFTVFFYASLALTGCSGVKNISYFHNVGISDSITTTSMVEFTEPTIQPDDILAISIFTMDPATGAQVNQVASQAIQGLNGANAINGFLVDKNGEIELSIIGKVKLMGLTTFQARDLIREKASVDYKNANVQVRFANFKVNVIGEVNRPALYTLPNEKVTVIDAIGLAGDLTLYGKRDNILVIREKAGKKEYARLNLYDTNIFKNPFYYLKQNDIVYVEPHKSKTAALNAPTRTSIGLILSAISVIVLAITRL